MSAHPTDRLERPLRALRLSVTDRCNLRCNYCMPHKDGAKPRRFLPRDELLRFEEIARLARVFAALGTRKLRLTGGEPLLRRELPSLVSMLRAIPEVEDLSLTTNALLLPRYARALRAAGLDRITVSLDSLDDATFGRINGRARPVHEVLEGIDAAVQAGFHPLKVNTVVQRGINDSEVVELARHFREQGHTVRFIEYMDVGGSRGWHLERVISSAEVLRRIGAEMPLEPLPPLHPGEVANRFRHRGSDVEVGVISSVSNPFCGACDRARLSARGELFTCLFATRGHDLRAPLRGGAKDADLVRSIAAIWAAREDRYSETRAALTSDLPSKVRMSYIGG